MSIQSVVFFVCTIACIVFANSNIVEANPVSVQLSFVPSGFSLRYGADYASSSAAAVRLNATLFLDYDFQRDCHDSNVELAWQIHYKGTTASKLPKVLRVQDSQNTISMQADQVRQSAGRSPLTGGVDLVLRMQENNVKNLNDVLLFLQHSDLRLQLVDPLLIPNMETVLAEGSLQAKQ